MKDRVVKYPGSIKKIAQTLDQLKDSKCYGILSKAGLPNGTLIHYGGAKEFGIITIILPSGEAFSGIAIKKTGDNDNPEAAACIAAGRAVAVWKAQGKPDEIPFSLLKSFSGHTIQSIYTSKDFGGRTVTTITSWAPRL